MKFKTYLNDLKKYGECIIDRAERNAFFDFCINKIDVSKYAMELTACEPIIDDELKQPLIIQYTSPVKTVLERCDFIVNDDFVTLKIGKKPESFNIIDAQFPQYENVIPADKTEDAHEFAIFSPEILKLVKQVFGDFVNRYQMTDRNAPCLVTNKTSEFKMVMMPYRYWVNNHS